MATPSLNHALTPLNVTVNHPSSVTVTACPNVGPPLPPPNPPGPNTITITLRLPAFPIVFFIVNGQHVAEISRTFNSKNDFALEDYTLQFVVGATNVPLTTQITASATNREPLSSSFKPRTLNVN